MDDLARVLLVDDDPEELELASRVLEREAAIEPVTVTDAGAALDALGDGCVDCVVSDYRMPGADGLELLEAVRADRPDLPFILLTAQGSEAVASEAISRGVTDYVRKGGGTDRYVVLANRIENAVEAHRAERAVRATRRRFRTLIEASTDAIVVGDPDGTIRSASAAIRRLFGYSPDELVGRSGYELIHPDDRGRVSEAYDDLLEHPHGYASVECRFRHGDGTWVWAEARGRNLLNDPAVGGIVVYIRDIGERKRRERELANLHRATRELVGAASAAGAARVAVEAARDILGRQFSLVWLLSADGATLAPVAVTEEARSLLGDRPTCVVGEGLVGRAFERGEPAVHDSVSVFEDTYVRGDARSVLLHPIGEYGILGMADPETAAFDESDSRLASILASNAEAVLARIVDEPGIDPPTEAPPG